jgi:hypothetical protein
VFGYVECPCQPLQSSSAESLKIVCSQESEERSRLAVSQSDQGQPNIEMMHSTQSTLPALQVLEGFITRFFRDSFLQFVLPYEGAISL